MAAIRCSIPCIDGHVHLGDLGEIDRLTDLRERWGFERLNLLALPCRTTVNGNPAALAAKAAHPDDFYMFGALDHAACFSEGRIATPSLAEQVDRLRAMGADGVKMLENKPTTRAFLDIPVDGDYFEPFFARMEATGFPIVWHVADPEEFWDPERIPAWARDKGWGYDESCVAKETLYAEVERVLRRHPGLRIIFAHFYFLSADLERAARLFEAFEHVHVDLALGVELLYNLSANRTRARDFFINYADRILFGSDVASDQFPDEADSRIGLIQRWLETDRVERIPEDADVLLGPPSQGIIRGLSLPDPVLRKIRHDNFVNLVGRKPAPLDLSAALAESERVAAAAHDLSGPEGASPALAAVCRLREMA